VTDKQPDDDQDDDFDEAAFRAHCERADREQAERAKANGHAGDADDVPDLGERDAGDDVDLPPPRRWLLGNQFCRTFLSGLVAPGSTGKSALRLAQCLSLATGRELTGQHVFARGRVLLVSLEDDQEEMQRRILAARLHHNVTLEDVKGWLFYATPKGIKLAEVKNGSRQIGMLEKSLRKSIERRRPDVLVLDPYVTMQWTSCATCWSRWPSNTTSPLTLRTIPRRGSSRPATPTPAVGRAPREMQGA
jgi:AAA domain